jgi:hypothetical protein
MPKFVTAPQPDAPSFNAEVRPAAATRPTLLNADVGAGVAQRAS